MTKQVIESFVWWLQKNVSQIKRVDGKFKRTQEKRLTKDLKAVFKKQINYLVDELSKLDSANAIKKNANDFRRVDQIVFDLPNQKDLVRAITDRAGVALSKGGSRSVKELKLGEFGISFSVKHPEAVKYLLAKATLELSNYKGNITDTTKTKVLSIITTGLENGDSYSSIGQSIVAQGDAGVFSTARAELIASREMGFAYEKGRKIPVDELLGKYPDRKALKSWATVGGGSANNVTPECEANEAEGWILFSESFSSGDNEAPRNDNPRCRCATNYKIE